MITNIILLSSYFIMYQTTWEWRNVYGCYIIVIYCFLLQITYITPFFVFFSYYKDKIYEEFIGSGKKLSFKFKLIQRLISPYFIIIFISIYTFIFIIFYLSLFIIFNFQCNQIDESIYYIIFSAHSCILVLF